MSNQLPTSVDDVKARLAEGGYLADDAIATAVFLAIKLGRPMLLEGEAGVGKTEIARVLATVLGRELVRLQCYEGLDLATAAYDWNYTRQLLHIRAAEASGEAGSAEKLEADLYDRSYLLARPLLRAIELANAGTPPVLLIDELDRADEPFEAFLLEFLADYELTIPELGTMSAATPPLTILTSNRTREVHDAVRRRCFYLWVDYPNAARELEILRLKVPKADDALSDEIVAFVQEIRGMDLYKNPGIAETINWAQALTALNAVTLNPEAVQSTLGTLLKYQDDIGRVQGSEAARILRNLKSDAAQAQAEVEAG
ncbi:MAG: MoxR family ATPase [Pseudomonadota bacterium]